jgi:hypothetical protein
LKPPVFDKGNKYLAALTLSVLSTAFYVFPSGYPQPGHVLLSLLVVSVLWKFKSVKFGPTEKILLGFLVYVVLINALFFWIHSSMEFLISAVYWIFGVLLLLTLRQIFLTDSRLALSIPIALILVTSISLFLSVLGNSDFFWGKRLIGTFNDPNQMSYWLLCSLVGTALASNLTKWINPNTVLPLFMPIFFLAFLAGSRSASLGLTVAFGALVGWLFSTARNRPNRLIGSEKQAGVAVLALVTALVLFMLVLYGVNDAVEVAVDDLLNRVRKIDIYWHLDIRGYTRLTEFPQFLLFGAGQGLDGRFHEGLYEIHSSFMGVLFYYGIFGFLLFFGFVYSLVKDRLSGWQLLIFSAPFVYGLFTFGLRTPIFWIMLSVLYTIPRKSEQLAMLNNLNEVADIQMQSGERPNVNSRVGP